MNKSIDNFETGAENLLLNCAQAKSGDRVLLVGEQCESPYFEPELCEGVAQVAQKLGMVARVVMAAPVEDARQFPKLVSDSMMDVDQTIFFSRLGDQVRFLETPGKSKKIMCYTLTRGHMSSPFASTNFYAMKQIDDLLTKEIKAATSYSIKTDCGTSLSSEIYHGSDSSKSAMTEFSLELFPVMIFPPVHFQNLCGRLVLKDFLLSSSTRAYEGSALILNSPVIVDIENSRIIDFEGDEKDIDRVKRQFERAASITGGDAWRINSWHTGINPHTFFEGDPYADLERWGTVAYGSPRYTHIHAAGFDPGDISIQIFDASISFDGKLLWDEGRFVFLDRPEVQALFSEGDNFDSSAVMSIGL
jgi:hypothetical protein